MTRDEAIARVDSVKDEGLLGGAYIVDILVALGLLHLDATSDKDRTAITAKLINVIIPAWHGMQPVEVLIGTEGAYRIFDAITGAGFKITRET